ncbi:MAG: hydroxymethylglutaryl-CoA lyase [Planctomycetes bacterium]|nr:hydroxymethylglutaryl-CoA lyase [Planctomycetota bacterium]
MPLTVTDAVTLTECPRDAFQGFVKFIPTDEKISYVNGLIKAGVRRIDFGSFVSPKAVPQMADTAAVFENHKHVPDLYLIAIVANLRGAEGLIACNRKWGHTGRKIAAAGFPMSVNETFQQRNTNKSLEEAWDELEKIVELCGKEKVEVVGYLSMAFGNPYGEMHEPKVTVDFARKLQKLGVSTVQLADTVGVATADQVAATFKAVREALPEMPLGVHLHAKPQTVRHKVMAALNAGCRTFDSAVGGIGGCPFAEDELVGNLDSIQLLTLLAERGLKTEYGVDDLLESAATAVKLQRKYSI